MGSGRGITCTTDGHGPRITDRSPLATAVVSLSTVAVSYPLVTAAAVGGAVLALSARRAIAATRDRHAAGMPEPTADRRSRPGNRSRHS